MRRYVSWIDIAFFASQPFMAMIVQLLGLERYQRNAVKLLSAITEKVSSSFLFRVFFFCLTQKLIECILLSCILLTKTRCAKQGMPAIDKLELIRRFGLLQMCRQCRPTAGSRFAVHLARWVNVLGKVQWSCSLKVRFLSLNDCGASCSACWRALRQ
jgi:hypothetical protein